MLTCTTIVYPRFVLGLIFPRVHIGTLWFKYRVLPFKAEIDYFLLFLSVPKPQGLSSCPSLGRLSSGSIYIYILRSKDALLSMGVLYLLNLIV